MNGKFIAGVIVLAAAAFGAVVYYTQEYAYYEELPASAGDSLTLTTVSGASEPFLADNFRAIDADSSPIRYRACFTTPMSTAMLTETYLTYLSPVPLNAPKWFDCFNAARIGADLERGVATAFLSQTNEPYGIDRVIAVYTDGRAFAWTQINRCGEVVFDGDPAPEGCPPAPEGY
ncbi:hypothetical protein AQS8620_01002 [Aquimixticola soesokkakensis]|uniref:Histidine kinase n=1 Tax=Aquimixticola soesokkakensis TaxID=1519096 RepID=A0A1Y5S3B0_9RHOB|nr:DUF6446 family protein [Aquimixticola soesokkakensis]SLN31214.1 hypothetical protein AQS8620_01002 [Aquimixticola soesokkakensis]